MRRWMIIITLSALAIAAVAGWGIGRLAGGGSDEPDLAVRVIPTLEPTAVVEPTVAPAATTPALATDASDSPASPAIVVASPPGSPPATANQNRTGLPDAP